MSATYAIGIVLEKIADLPNKSNVLSPHDYEKIEGVTLDFFYIQAFCRDAEMRHDPNVRRWVTKTRDLAYRMEDVLDTIVIMEDEFPQSNHGKMEAIKGILKISRKAYNYRKTINSLKKEINQIQLEFITVYKNRVLFGINAIYEQRSRSQPMPNIDSDIIGYTSEKDYILQKLLDKSTPRLAVVSIVGTAGIGKTALANNVFRRHDVDEHFELKIWVSVSEKLNFCHLLSKVLMQIRHAMPEDDDTEDVPEHEDTEDVPEHEDTEDVPEHEDTEDVSEHDDTEDVPEDDDTEDVPEHDDTEDVPEHDDTEDVPEHEDTEDVPEDDDTEDVPEHEDTEDVPEHDDTEDVPEHDDTEDVPEHEDTEDVPEHEDTEDVPEHEDHTKEHFSSAIQRLLRGKDVPEHEDHTKEHFSSAIQRLLRGKKYLIVLDHVAPENFRVNDALSRIADAFPDKNKGSRILLTTRFLYVAKEADPKTEPCELQFLTSYEDLPNILKLCVLYLAAFPKNYEICTQSLTHMWVAEGLITLTYGTVSKEEIAERFLEELAQRFMIQVSRRSPEGSITCFRVHPELHDVAIKKSKEVKMVTVCSNEYFDPEDFRRARRVAVHHSDSKVMRYTSPVVRSLLCFKYPIPELGRHRMLRVLSCMGGKMEGEMKLEKLIEMTQLRYLKIGGLGDPGNLLSCMKRLQTIDLREGDHGDLPDYIWQVKTLRHVMLKGYTFGPTSSANLPNLRTLTGIKNKESWETGLPTLPNLRELDVQLSQGSPWKVIVNFLNTLQHLEHLNVVGDEVPTRVVNMRSFPFYNCLRSLSLKEDRPEYYGYEMPSSSSIFPEDFSQLSQLILENFRLKQDPMPVLEKNVPLLKMLRLGYRSFEDEKMSCSDGGFANLEKLELFVLEKLKEWEIEKGAMPKLQELKVSCCPKLGVPQGLRYLTNLQELSWASHADSTMEAEIRNICKGVPTVSIVDLSQ